MGASGHYKPELSINIVSGTPRVPPQVDRDVDLRCWGQSVICSPRVFPSLDPGKDIRSERSVQAAHRVPELVLCSYSLRGTGLF